MTDHSAPSAADPSAPTDAESLLAALDPEQREVASSFGSPICVLAGAGTGKTRAITHRIAYGVATGQLNPRHVLADCATSASPRFRPAPSMPPRCDSCGTSGRAWWVGRCRS